MASYIEFKKIPIDYNIKYVSFATGKIVNEKSIQVNVIKAGGQIQIDESDWDFLIVNGENRISWNNLGLDTKPSLPQNETDIIGGLMANDRIAIRYDVINEKTSILRSEQFFIDNTILNNKYIKLSYNVNSDTLIDLKILGQPYQNRPDSSTSLDGDFYLSNNYIKWDNKNLKDKLKYGDIIEVSFDSKENSKGVIKVIEVFYLTQTDIDNRSLTLQFPILEDVSLTNNKTYYNIIFELNKSGFHFLNNPFIVINKDVTWKKSNDFNLYEGDVLSIIYYTDIYNVDESNIFKINEKRNIIQDLKNFTMNPRWVEEFSSLWEFLSASNDYIGRTIFERIANFTRNNRDIDLCNLQTLNSISYELDQENLFSFNLKYPPELERLMNIFSIHPNNIMLTGKILHEDTIQRILLSKIVDDIEVFSNEQLNTIFDTDPNTGYFKNINDQQNLKNESIIENSKYIGFIKKIFYEHLKKHTRFYYIPNNINPIDYGLTDNFYSEYTIDEILNKLKEYNFFKNNWSNLYSIVQYYDTHEYIAFLSNILPLDSQIFCPANSAEVLSEASIVLTNICTKARYYRESLKNVVKKYSMYGTANAITEIASEAFKRGFTNKKEWSIIDDSGISEFEQFMPSIEELSGFKINIIEYWDPTEYLNIFTPSPYKISYLGTKEVSGISGSFDNWGYWITGYYTEIQPYSGENISLGYSITGGNDRFWERESNYIKSSQSNESISSFFYNLKPDLFDSQSITSDLFSNYIRFQKVLWNNFAVSGWNRNSNIYDLSGIPPKDLSIYNNIEDIPLSDWIIPPTSLEKIHFKYSGESNAFFPPENIKNQNFPTVAPLPFIWNFIEKLYNNIIPIFNTIIPSDVYDLSLNEIIDNNGILKDSWKIKFHEYIGYQTRYENSLNLNYNFIEKQQIDKDGSFNYDCLNNYILYNDIDNLSSYYKEINSNFNKNGIYSSIKRQLKFFRNDILSLSGITIYDIDKYYSKKIFDNTTKLDELIGINNFNEVLSGKILINYKIDINGNHWMLYKTKNEFETLGEIWIRYNNHPMPFPATFKIFENINTLNNAFDILTGTLDYNKDLLEYNEITNTNSLSFFKIKQSGIKKYIAEYYPERGTTLIQNPYNKSLRICDNELQQLFIDNPIFGIEYMLNNAYTFDIIGSFIILIGKRYPFYYKLNGTNSLADTDYIVIFEVGDIIIDSKNNNDICSENLCDIKSIQKVYSLLTDSEHKPSCYRLPLVSETNSFNGIKSYIGHYEFENYIIFIIFKSFNSVSSTIILDFIYFDKNLKSFIQK